MYNVSFNQEIIAIVETLTWNKRTKTKTRYAFIIKQ